MIEVWLFCSSLFCVCVSAQLPHDFRQQPRRHQTSSGPERSQEGSSSADRHLSVSIQTHLCHLWRSIFRYDIHTAIRFPFLQVTVLMGELLFQVNTMACTAAKAAKASSSARWGKTWLTPAETARTVQSTSGSATAASTAATRSVWPWAWREKVLFIYYLFSFPFLLYLYSVLLYILFTQQDNFLRYSRNLGLL